jgi:MFS family permease
MATSVILYPEGKVTPLQEKLFCTLGGNIRTIAAAKIQNLAPSRMRAQVTALYLMVVAFIGTGFGPIVVAVITDYVFANDATVGYSLALVALVTIPLGSGSLYLGLGARGRSNVEKDTTSAAAP